MSRKKYYHSRIVKEISDETGIDIRVIHLIIRKFYNGIRIIIRRNEEVNIKGFFILKMHYTYKKLIEKKGKDINLRRRKDQKYDYVKKSKK